MKTNTEIKEKALQSHLRATLDYVNNTCILGADNRIEDIKRTNGWSYVQMFRQHYGSYLKGYNEKFKRCNPGFDPETNQMRFKDNNSAWFYYPDDINNEVLSLHMEMVNPGQHPLADPVFNLSVDNQYMLAAAMLTLELRYGNCGLRSNLGAKYLWENPSDGIYRIECFSWNTVDHDFIVVNRQGDDLEGINSWGDDCWILDFWLTTRGLIIHASKFEEKIKDILDYLKQQKTKLTEIGIVRQTSDKTVMNRFYRDFEIIPARDRYPTYEKSRPIESYYRIASGCTKDFISNFEQYKRVHKEKFDGCLETIRTIKEDCKYTSPSKHRFFSNPCPDLFEDETSPDYYKKGQLQG